MGSDQKYAANQHICRQFARERGIRVYEINKGVGTHLTIEEGLAVSGSTVVSTDSHANTLGAIGAFGQGMGNRNIATAWAFGKVWFKVPASVKINLNGKRPVELTVKDIVMNLLNHCGANQLLGYSVEITGPAAEELTLDERITIASMATEMGAIIILFAPNKEVIEYCPKKSGKTVAPLLPEPDAEFEKEFNFNVAEFKPMVSRPGHPDDAVPINSVEPVKIDSAFIGSCTNGRIEDLRLAAQILKGRKVVPGVVLKIVPSTDRVWQQMMQEGILEIFKKAGALVGNRGYARCAASQVGQNGPGEITVSTGNRNLAGKQGKGQVYLASPAVVATSTVAGYLTTPEEIPETPAVFDGRTQSQSGPHAKGRSEDKSDQRPIVAEGRAWIIPKDDIDTDKIFHKCYLAITNIEEMGQYTFDNLEGFEDFAPKAHPGDIVITGENFSGGSSRQQAVDCFESPGVQAVIAESFGAIYKRNAINAAFPILTYSSLEKLDLQPMDKIRWILKKAPSPTLKTTAP